MRESEGGSVGDTLQGEKGHDPLEYALDVVVANGGAKSASFVLSAKFLEIPAWGQSEGDTNYRERGQGVSTMSTLRPRGVAEGHK